MCLPLRLGLSLAVRPVKSFLEVCVQAAGRVRLQRMKWMQSVASQGDGERQFSEKE